MTPPEREAERLIETLGLTSHPEGGWYRETWRSTVLVGERAAGTSIHFLLEAGQQCRWHQVDADEFWLWHAGSPLEMRLTDRDGGMPERIMLGPDIHAGEKPQLLIPAHHWQAAAAPRGWALVSCMVVPGFEFSGFALASQELTGRLDRAVGVPTSEGA